MFSFYLPGTAAILLRTHTWMGDIAIANCLRNYGRDRQQFWIKSRKPGNHHYHFVPNAGGWRVLAGPLSDPRGNPFVEPPF